MDATNDAIVATACDYNWDVFKNYAVSIGQSGFRGHKIIFVNNITTTARQTLKRLGFELIDYEKKEKNVVIQRFALLSKLLEHREFRYVIQSDIKDVVVQTDPSVWMEQHFIDIVGASEFILYRDEHCNPLWVEKLYGKEMVKTLADKEVICAGTIAADADSMRMLSSRIYEASTDRFGDDQAALNVLLRGELAERTCIPNVSAGFILTAGWWLIGDVKGNSDRPIGMRSNLRVTPPVLKDGVAYPAGSDKPFCIVHQYDRGSAWAPAISKRYQLDFSVPQDAPIPHNGYARTGGPLKYYGDGMTLDWHDTHSRS